VKPSALGKSLSLWMAEYLELSPFFFAVGNIVFRSLIKKTPDDNIDDPILPTILALGISFAHFVIPVYPIAKKCFSSGERDSSYKQTYSDMRIAFNNDYDISNPIYRDTALQNWRKLVEQTANGESTAAAGTGQQQASNNIQNALQHVRQYAQFAQGLSQVQNPHRQAGVPPTRLLYPQINAQPTNLNFGAGNGAQSIPYQPVAYPQQNMSGPQYISGGAGFIQNQPNPAPRNMMTYGQPYQYPQYPPQQWQQPQPQPQPMMYPMQNNIPQQNYVNQHIPRNIPYQQQYMMNPQNTYPMNQNQNQFNMELQPNYNNPPTRLNFYQGAGGPSQN